MFNWKNSKNYEENYSDAQYNPLDIDEDNEIEISSTLEFEGYGGLESGYDL